MNERSSVTMSRLLAPCRSDPAALARRVSSCFPFVRKHIATTSARQFPQPSPPTALPSCTTRLRCAALHGLLTIRRNGWRSPLPRYQRALVQLALRLLVALVALCTHPRSGPPVRRPPSSRWKAIGLQESIQHCWHPRHNQAPSRYICSSARREA